MRRLASIVLLLTVSTGHASFGALPVGGEPICVHFGRSEGLPDHVVTELVQDGDGYVWIGTRNGISRFDGLEFRNYGPADGLDRPYVMSAVLDFRQELWLVAASSAEDGPESTSGLYRYDAPTDRWSEYKVTDSGAGPLYLDLAADSLGGIWIAAASSFLGQHLQAVRVDPERGVTQAMAIPGAGLGSPVQLASVARRDFVSAAMIRTASGEFWLAGTHRLFRFKPESRALEPYPLPAEWSRFNVRRLIEADGDGAFWVLLDHTGRDGSVTGPGICRFDTISGEYWCRGEDVATSAMDSRTGIMWFSTGSGLCSLEQDGTGLRCFDLSPDWRGQRAADLFGDIHGKLWIPLDPSGITLFDPVSETAEYYPGNRDVMADESFTVSLDDRYGALWIGSMNGLTRCNPAGSMFQTIRPGESDSEVHSLARGSNGEVLAGMAGEVLSISGDATRRRLPSEAVPYAVIEAGGRILAGSHLGLFEVRVGEGVRRFPDQDACAAIPGCDELFSGSAGAGVYALALDEAGSVWAASCRQVIRFDIGGKGRSYLLDRDVCDRRYVDHPWSLRLTPLPGGDVLLGSPNGLRSVDAGTGAIERIAIPLNAAPRIQDIVLAGGLVWISTESAGLWYGNSSDLKLTRVDLPELNDGPLSRMLVDRTGRLWIGSDDGLLRFDPVLWRVRQYTEYDGVEPDGFVNAATSGSRDRLFFGGRSGVIEVDPWIEVEDIRAPDVVLRSVRLPASDSVASLLGRSTLKLNHRDDSPVFVFDGLHSLRPPSTMRFRYRLEGYEDDWVEQEGTREAHYYGIPPGRYRFTLQAADADGRWTGREVGLSVRVASNPLRNPWLYALIVVLGAALAVLWTRARIARVRAHASALRRMVAQRTQQLRNEKRLTEAQAESLADLHEARTHLIEDVGHELRTPLTLIAAPLKDLLAGRRGRLTSGVQRVLGTVIGQADRLQRLTDQLLSVAHLNSGTLQLHGEPVDIALLIKLNVSSFSAAGAERGMTIRCMQEPGPLWVVADIERVTQILSNLIGNAVRHGSQGGTVLVSVSTTRIGSEVELSVAVTDNGPGIPESRHQQIFERFESGLHEGAGNGVEQAGRGLGLAIVKDLVELHNGTISVRSNLGEGSTFSVTLPFVAAESGMEPPLPPASASASLEAPESRASEDTILVIDDDEDVLQYLRDLIGSRWKVMTARTGVDGIALARSVIPTLVLCDVAMPQMSGIEVCRKLKSDHATRIVPVVLLTAKTSQSAVMRGLNAGADAYITKPFDPDILLGRIASLVEGRRMLREDFSHQVILEPTGMTMRDEDDGFLEEVLDSIEAHLSDSRYNVDQLADEVHLSARQLTRRVEAMCGESPGVAIRRCRIACAKKMLEAGAYRVGEVAAAVGFSGTSNFSAAFKRETGVRPSGWAAHASS